MVDNFRLIAFLLREREQESPLTDDDFFFLQVIRRKKDNPDMARHREVVGNWYVTGADHLLELEPLIVKQCVDNNARAYFRLNKRSRKRVALQTMARIAQNIAAGNYDIRNCYDSCAGLHPSDDRKTWLIDIDRKEDQSEMEYMTELSSIMLRIVAIHDNAGTDDSIWMLPTKNGHHLICYPFDVRKLHEKFPDVSFHRDNPTILYIP